MSRLVHGALTRDRSPGLRWRKVLGSGYQGGFGLRPAVDRLGLFCVFDTTDDAQHWLLGSPDLARWQMRAQSMLTLTLQATRSRGSWSGHSLEPVPGEHGEGLLASLTRASIRPGQARRFWALSPAAEASLARAPGCSLAVGLGEAPLLRQATFSLWQSAASMDAFARSGAHLEAIQQAYSREFFSESMFVRFRVLQMQGNLRDMARE